VVLVPTLAGALLHQTYPATIRRASKFTPVLATFLVALIIGSTLGQNVDAAKSAGLKLVSAVLVLHSAGFLIGYWVSRALGLSEKICRTNSIEVGMQNSALGVVLANLHFAADPTVAAPCAISACTHATLGSLLAGYWRSRTPEEEEEGDKGLGEKAQAA
jgi:BASS family bile acid:Na+ symporter